MSIGYRKEIRKLTFWALALRRSESSLVLNITVKSQYQALYFVPVVSARENLTRILLLTITNSVVLLATLLMVYLNNRVFLSTNHLNTECFCRGTIGW